MALTTCFFASMCMMFLDPVLSVRLIDLGFKETQTGYGFALIGFSFAVGSIFVGSISKFIEVKIMFLIGTIIAIFGILLSGPTLLFGGLPNKAWILLVGIFFMGFSIAFLYVPVTPEIIRSCGQK